MTAANAVLLTNLVNGFALRLVFERQADRVGHRLELVRGAESRPVLLSAEGDDQQNWPPSPALQSVHVEQREHGLLALLVGMSGTSHWSASAEALPGEAAMVFDVACRVKQLPERLDSTYRLQQVAGVEVTPGELRIELAREGQRIAIQSIASDDENSGDCRLVYDENRNQVSVGPTLPAGLKLPNTVRWRYRIALLA